MWLIFGGGSKAGGNFSGEGEEGETSGNGAVAAEAMVSPCVSTSLGLAPKQSKPAGTSYAEMVNKSLEVAIILGDGQQMIGKEAVDIMAKQIRKAVYTVASGEKPKFNGQRLVKGSFRWTCATEGTKQWLIETVEKLPAFNGNKWLAVDIADLPKLQQIKVDFWLGNDELDDPQDYLKSHGMTEPPSSAIPFGLENSQCKARCQTPRVIVQGGWSQSGTVGGSREEQFHALCHCQECYRCIILNRCPPRSPQRWRQAMQWWRTRRSLVKEVASNQDQSSTST